MTDQPSDAIAAMEFAPPAGYAFEPELVGPAPRALPDSLNDGPHARESRVNIVRVFAFGLICFVLTYIPGVETLAYYLLPLAHLKWIGLASLVIAAGGVIHYSQRRGPFRYVREGVPLVARVADLCLEPSKLGHDIYAYKATIVHRHPDTGAIIQSFAKSKGIAPLRQHKYAPRFKVGDYVTAIYLPGKKLERSLRLYAFLDLSPEVNIRHASTDESPLWIGLWIVGVVSLIVVLVADWYALQRYQPLDLEFRQVLMPAATGAIVLGAGYILRMRRHQQGQPRRHLQAVARGVSVLVIGAMTGVCWGFMVNAWLDRSPGHWQPARIEKFWTTTYHFIFRSYSLGYRLAESSGSHRLLTTLEHQRQFRSRHAVANVRQGALGWKWVEAVEPAPKGED